MAASPILTQGLGSFGSVNVLPTLGYGGYGLGGVATDAVTKRLTLTGASQQRLTLIGASAQRLTLTGASQERLTLTGSSDG